MNDITDDAIDTYAGRYFDALMRAADGDPDAPPQMAQAIAMMSDETLHTVVALFGTDPAPHQGYAARRDDRDAVVHTLAREHLYIDTLDTRGSDSLDFHEVAVWGVRAALEAAYEAGRL
jgi:hypothetical protein